MDTDYVIQVENLTKIYKIFDRPIDRIKEAMNLFHKRYSKDFYALTDVSFSVKKGETVGFIGKNGAGKSTLLKILTGVLTPSSGTVKINGRVASLLELGAGFNPEMTGIENIYMNGTIMGYSKEEIDGKIADIIEFAGVGDFINQPVKMYSSGMFARLAFALNVYVEPDILIVDEALSVGDAFFQQKCLGKMRQLIRDGVTVFFVSHAIEQIKSLCSRCIYLEQGRIFADGESANICDLYQNKSTDISCKNILNNSANNKVEVKKRNGRHFRIDKSISQRITERSGSMELELTALDIYNGEQPTNTMEADGPIRILFSFMAHANIPAGTAVGLLCRNKLGIDIFTCNLNFWDIYLPAMKKGEKSTLDVTFSVPLAPGEYFLSCGAKPDPMGTYYYDRAFNVEVLRLEQPKMIEHPVGGLMIPKIQQVTLYNE